MYTIVQHSGYGYAGDRTFLQGLETREVPTKAEQKRVEKAGGILFDSYDEAEDFCYEAMYEHPQAFGLTPQAMGTFSDKEVDQLAIYIPVRKAVG